jgi:hypothetical protein
MARGKSVAAAGEPTSSGRPGARLMSKTQRSRWPMPGKAQEVGVVGPSQPFEPAAVAGRQQHECVRIARARRGTPTA